MTIHGPIGGIEGSGLHIPIQHAIWRDKYKFTGGGDAPDYPNDLCIQDTWDRVAFALSQAEKPEERGKWELRFRDALADFKFLPGGRILAGAGTGRSVTLFNCFVMGRIPDSIDGIFAHVREAAMTMQQGGGIGMDFSTIRPKGAEVKGVAAEASGPLSFMDVWDAMCRTIMSAGARRGAMMGTMRCDHPDIEAFIGAKLDRTRFRNFNVSMLATDAFMEAVKAGEDWELVFNGKVYKTVRARMLFDKATRNAYDSAEPGIIFIDRVNAANNLRYCETIYASNPCGEQMLPPYGACLLGSLNLAAFVKELFTDAAWLDIGALAGTVETAVRMLDNVIDISNYPLPQQEAEAKGKRRIGLGITGLANALAMCELHYGSEEACSTAAEWMKAIAHGAYNASAELAREKGTFLLHRLGEFLPALDVPTGCTYRNSHLLSIAPTGTISLLAGNVSGGIEPIFDLEYERKVLEKDGTRRPETVQDFAWRQFREMFPDRERPDYFVTAHQLSPQDHLRMQAALQPYVDSAISKTVNCPRDMPFEEFQNLYLDAHKMGLKGCTAYRPNDITGAVLTAGGEKGPDIAVKDVDSEVNSAVEAEEGYALTNLGREAAGMPPLPRDAMLYGATYKLKWPGSEHAIYVTINNVRHDIERFDMSHGSAVAYDERPYEIFINSKNLEHYAWTVALTRMVSAIFRRGGDIAFVAEELKQIFDPRGGAWMDGRYVPSLLAAIGGIIETHFEACGMRSAQCASRPLEYALAVPPQASEERERQATESFPLNSSPLPRTFCPKCSSAAVVMQEGCKRCLDCGWSQCG